MPKGFFFGVVERSFKLGDEIEPLRKQQEAVEVGRAAGANVHKKRKVAKERLHLFDVTETELAELSISLTCVFYPEPVIRVIGLVFSFGREAEPFD